MGLIDEIKWEISDLMFEMYVWPGYGRWPTIGVLLIGGLFSLSVGRLFYDAKEEFKGFPRLEQGYAVTEFFIPTRGDVEEVERLVDVEYQEISGERGPCGSGQMSAAEDEVLICGEFRYRIQGDFFTEYTASPDAFDPFVDVREGYVRLKKVDED